MAKLVVFKKGGGGKVAINPEQVTHVRSAAGAFTDVFFGGQQVAVEGSFEEIVALLAPARSARPPRRPAGRAAARRPRPGAEPLLAVGSGRCPPGPHRDRRLQPDLHRHAAHRPDRPRHARGGRRALTITYRVDLASNLWCSDECASPEPVVLVTDTELLLRESHVPSGGRTTIVGRLIGLFADTSIDGNDRHAAQRPVRAGAVHGVSRAVASST